MHRFSSPVLQTLQRGREAEEEGGRSKGEATAEGEQQAGPETRPKACHSSWPSPGSPSAPFEGEAPRHARLSGEEISSGGRGRVGRRAGEHSIGSETSIEGAQLSRPTDGPRTLGTPRWPSAAETIPSQLLGGRAEGNAYFLGSDTTDFAIPLAERESKQQPSQAEHLPSSLSAKWTSRHDAKSTLSSFDSVGRSIPNTLAASDSSSSITTKSKASQKSDASSFAYLLRDHRKDMRLFKKSSRPSQHLRKPAALVKKPREPRRTSSFYKPKVVEDTAALLAPAPPPKPPEPSLGLKPPTPILSSPKSAIRKSRSSPSQSTSESAPTTPALAPPVSRPSFVPIFSRDYDFSRSAIQTRHAYSEAISPLSEVRSTDSPKNRHYRHPSPSPGSTVKRRYRPATPPEREPQPLHDSANKHGQHYFRTFGIDTMYQTPEFLPPLGTPSEHTPHDNALENVPSPMPSPPPVPHPANDTIEEVIKDRKRSSFFGVHRYPPGPQRIFHAHKGETDLPTSPTPDIVVHSSPQLAKGRRRSTVASYFSKSRPRAHPSPERFLSPAVSGLSTNWEDTIAENQPTGHMREISEPVSPFSTPPAVKRPQPTPLQDKSPERTRELPQESVVPLVPSGAVIGPQPKYESAIGEEFYKVSFSGPNAPSFLPSEMKRVDTPPESKRPQGFKGFFFDMRSMPPESGEEEPESPEPRAIKRPTPIFQTHSMQLLFQKFSTPKSKRKASNTTDESRKSSDPLAVTGFEQTPYSQRYGDARRAKMSQVRSYVEQALNEDIDDDEESVFPFVLNVPDHLPNSPLCPLSPKHQSGGKAIYPIHGRKRTTFGQIQKKTTKVRKQEPTIVFESGQHGDGMTTPELEDLRRMMSKEY